LIKNGVAHSDNIRMDGVAGDMKMTGHTDLNSNTLDYNVSFKPKVTANLPAIAAWAIGGPVALFAAIAVDKIVESAAVISELKLKISGELSEPKVEEVERFTRTVKLPPTKKPGPNKSQSSKPESKSNSKVPESIESIEEKGL